MTSNKSELRTKLSSRFSAVVVANACHAIIDAASVCLADIEFLAGAMPGSQADRVEALSGVRSSVMRLVGIVKDLQLSANAAHAAA